MWQDNRSNEAEGVQGVTTRQAFAKRGYENEHGAGTKKGRSAFGDLTNSKSNGRRQPKVNEKVDSKGAKAVLQEQRPTNQAILEKIDLRDLSDAEMEFELCSPSALQPWKDIDKEDRGSPMACADIANDIMNNLFRAERCKRPLVNYMETRQPDVTPQMRSILVDWLVEVAQEYKLVPETLCLAVDYVDRYLSVVPTARNHLQLVGVTCMLLASKYEEIYAPTVEDFCFITENTYSKEEMLLTERRALDALNFELTVPTVRIFLRRFVKAAAASASGRKPIHRLDLLSSYVAELAMLEYQALQYLPSKVAASAVLLAQFCLTGEGWNQTLNHYTSYTARELKPCVTFLHQCYLGARSNELPAIREKYSGEKYGCVAEKNPPATLPYFLFL